MDTYVRPQIYSSMPVHDVESQLRRDKMPAPFIRRMRVLNLLSAVTLRKADDNILAPFNVMDLHHILDAQISQDAIIEALENRNLAHALETGNLQPLWVESKKDPLLRKGFEQGWIQRFVKKPFDPICVMLAMRSKLMLDVVDELGHSYDLLRSLGMGWIDFGEIPGEEAGDPDSYVPPLINTSIDYPEIPPGPVPTYPEYVPGPGEPGYIAPVDMTPSDPGYTTTPGSPGYIAPGDMTFVDPGFTTTPGSPGYITPGDMTPSDPGYTTTPGSPGYIAQGDVVPGEPGYVPVPGDQGYIPPPDRVPGDPGYPRAQGEAPGYPEGWDEGIVPGHPDYDPGPGEPGYKIPPSPGEGLYGGYYGPGGRGAAGGPNGAGGLYGSLASPLSLGVGPDSLLSRGWSSAHGVAGGVNCCLDYENPENYVGMGYETLEMNVGDDQELTVTQAHPSCDGDNYEWLVTAGGGELSALTGLSVTYTAPTSGHGCPGNTEITLYCAGEVMATLDITMFYAYVIDYDYDTSAETIARETSENIYVTANNTPLTWSVSGTGFSLEHEETDGTGNVLHADNTACGSAKITVKGCDDQEAVGIVRCTTGQWGSLTNGCVLDGEPDSKNWDGAWLRMEKIEGKYKQEQTVKNRTGVPFGGCDAIDCLDGGSCVECLDWSCADTPPYTVECGEWCCGGTSCGDAGGGYCKTNEILRYREWTC